MSTMNLDTFTDHLDHYGPRLRDWPAELRESAEQTLLHCADAAARFESAGKLEALLAAERSAFAPVALKSRIIAAIPEDPWIRIRNWFSATLWRPALAAGLPLAFGFLFGVWQADLSSAEAADRELADRLGALALSNSFEDPTDEY